MPVKLAVCLGGAARAAATVDKMLAAQRSRRAQVPGVAPVGGGALGWLCRADHPRPSWLRKASNGSTLLVAGAPISMGAPVEAVLAGALNAERPEDVLTQLDGAFAAVVWDGRRQRLIVVTDILGLQPLYFAEGERLLIASEMKALAAALGRVEMDVAGWGAFAAMGHFLGDTTSVAGVRRVPAASVLAWNAEGRKLEERRHWNQPEPRAVEPDTGAIVDALEREIRSYASYHAPGTVLLSGGFDSRLLLCLLKRLGYQPDALSVGHPGERLDADGRYAREIAAALGVRCRFVPPAPGFYSSAAYRRYLAENEVANPSAGLFIARVASELHSEMTAAWEGVSPGYTLAFPRIPRPDLATYLRHRCQAAGAPVHAAARLVFRDGAAMRVAFDRELTEEAAACPPGDGGLLAFEARHQMRNRMAHNPLKVYSNDVLCFTPGLSREFWELAASIPYAAKWDFRLYFRIFRDHFPEALRVPFCSAGQLWSDRLRFAPAYHAARLFPPPGAQAAAQLWKRWRGGAPLPPIVGRTVASIDPGHPDLNADAVGRLQRTAPNGPMAREARALLFYWRMWRDVMEGRTQSAETAGEAAA